MSLPALVGALGVREIVPVPELGASTTNVSELESVPSGFCSCTVKFPANCKSGAASEVMHCELDTQNEVRGVPATRIVEPGPGEDEERLYPETSRVKPPAEPAYALVGAREKIAGPPEIVTIAVPDWFGSATLVATTVNIADKGAAAGAVYSPVESMDPQSPDWPQPAPVMDQLTPEFSAPVTIAENWNFPAIAITAFPGCTVTPMWARIVTLADALSPLPAWLVAVIRTGLGDGNPEGAM
jgi:hypothetical protein